MKAIFSIIITIDAINCIEYQLTFAKDLSLTIALCTLIKMYNFSINIFTNDVQISELWPLAEFVSSRNTARVILFEADTHQLAKMS